MSRSLLSAEAFYEPKPFVSRSLLSAEAFGAALFLPIFSCRSFCAGLTFTRAPIHKDYPQNIRMKKCPHQKTRSVECFGVSNMMFPGLACLPNTKSPPIPTKCFSKHEKPINANEMLGQTRKAHQYQRNAQQNTKCPPNPDLTPGPSPIGRGEHAS